MAVEDLVDARNEIRKIDDLVQIERDRKTALDQYRLLQRGVFWDDKQKMWNNSTDSNQNIVGGERHFAIDQLSGIFVEGLFNTVQARMQFEKAKHIFWDEKAGLWGQSKKLDSNDKSKYFHIRDQFLGVLIEGMFDKDKAAAQYDQLKQSPFYSPRQGLWNVFLDENHMSTFIIYQYRYSFDQLLGVLTEAMFHKQNAFVQFDSLKQSKFYDPVTQRWDNMVRYDSPMQGKAIHSGDQLLGILCESLFDKKKARELLKENKDSEIYDPNTGLWYKGIVELERVSKHEEFLTKDQLLAVAVEKQFEDEDVLENNLVPLVRRF